MKVDLWQYIDKHVIKMVSSKQKNSINKYHEFALKCIACIDDMHFLPFRRISDLSQTHISLACYLTRITQEWRYCLCILQILESSIPNKYNLLQDQRTRLIPTMTDHKTCDTQIHYDIIQVQHYFHQGWPNSSTMLGHIIS